MEVEISDASGSTLLHVHHQAPLARPAPARLLLPRAALARALNAALGSHAALSYRVRASPTGAWSLRHRLQVAPGRALADWGGARWLCTSPHATDSGTSMLRADFVLPPNDRVVQATAHVVGLGQFRLRVNGINVMAGEVNAPGWTDWRKRVLFSSYAVPPTLFAPTNTIAMQLGNGMYNVPQPPDGRYTKWVGSFGPRMMLLRLEVMLATGANVTVLSEQSAGWTGTDDGPITVAHEYGGEDFNASHVMPGWDRPGFAPGAPWIPANDCTANAPEGAVSNLVAADLPPVQVVATLPLQAEPAPLPGRPGTVLLDFGRNFAGNVRINVSNAQPGSTLRATPYEARVGSAPTQCSGGCPMYWRTTAPLSESYGNASVALTLAPTFATYGFRWVEVEFDTTAYQGNTSIGDAAGNGTVSVVTASYGANCRPALRGKLTSVIAAACTGNASCTYTVCVCGTASCAGVCLPDPAPGCAKAFNATYRCSGDAAGTPLRVAYIPAEANLATALLTCLPLPPGPALTAAVGLEQHANVRQVGNWSCSSAWVNRLHEMIVAAVAANLQSVLTDCPHRCEWEMGMQHRE